MNKKNIFPQQTQPVVRGTQGTQTDLLAELSEEVLSLGGTSARSIMASSELVAINNVATLKCYCSYDGD